MAEESESKPGDGSDGGDDPDAGPDDAPGAESDGRDADEVPGGSIHDYLDEGEGVALDETAPAGDTGTDDPIPEDERKSVSDAVGAPVPEEELEEDPDLDLKPSIDAGAEGTSDGAADDGETDPDPEFGAATSTPPAEGGPTTAEAAEATPDTASTPTVDGTDTDAVGQDPPADPTVDDGLVGEGPASDEEMPLADHIEEMVKRLAVVLVVAGVVAVAVFPVADDAINFLWNAHIPGATTVEGRRPRLYGPLELLVTELKVAALAGFVVGLPVFVYQTYLFMRPGLFPRERRYYLAAVPTSLVLAFVGVAFAHFAVLPAIFAYFTAYTTGTATIAFGLKETFGLILVLMGYMALVFQIPLFIMLAIMMNLTTRVWLEDKRLLFWGGFLGLSFLISPDPTGMAPIIVAATMITLFEGTLALLRWTGN
jgi:sec-independent protein translocase protein TatC